MKPALPDVDSLREVQLQVPLRVYTRDGRLIAAIGEQRRIPVRYDQLPPKLIQAFLATEDDRFFRHHGVDWQGILRAAVANARAGGIRQGASTITMQVARDMFLTPRRDMKRKMSEIYISLLMESEFSKEEIFSLYVNKIFLGQRAYGVGAAAEVYFGKSLDQLSIAELATLAGIPTAPSAVNPVANAEAAKARRAHVLGRMLELHYITPAEYEAAKNSPMESRLHGPSIEVDAPYVAEMVRNELQAKYGDSIYTAGYRVFTTIDSRLEDAATVALRTGLLEYDRRHGWRGATAKVDLSKITSTADLDAELEEFPAVGGLRPAIVQKVEAKSARIYVKELGPVNLPWEKMSWARRELPDEKVDRSPSGAADIFSRGDVIYTVGNSADNLQFVQVPEAQSALVALDPRDGGVVALVGGFDFFQSKFNRVTQARRQPGSGFKPFVYSAAFDKGYTPASIVEDAPIVIDAAGMEQAWRPKDFENEFSGPIRLREALVHSRNLVSIRLMRDIGAEYTRGYVQRFGFDKSQLPDDLTLAVGTAELSPLQLAAGYATFANGGFRVTPYYIDRIEDASGKVLLQADPAIACADCGRVTDPSAATGAKGVAGGAAAQPARSGHTRRQVVDSRQEPGAANHQAASGVSAGRHDGGCHSARHRHRRAGAQPRRPRRQDRHHQRFSRRLVQRFQRQSGRHGVDRVRPGSHAGRWRAGRPRGAADLGVFHASGAGRCAAAHGARSRRYSHRAHLSRHRVAGERRQSERNHGKIHRRQFTQVRSVRRAEFESDERWRQTAFLDTCPRNIRSAPKICAAHWRRKPRASWPSTA